MQTVERYVKLIRVELVSDPDKLPPQVFRSAMAGGPLMLAGTHNNFPVVLGDFIAYLPTGPIVLKAEAYRMDFVEICDSDLILCDDGKTVDLLPMLSVPRGTPPASVNAGGDGESKR